MSKIRRSLIHKNTLFNLERESKNNENIDISDSTIYEADIKNSYISNTIIYFNAYVNNSYIKDCVIYPYVLINNQTFKDCIVFSDTFLSKTSVHLVYYQKTNNFCVRIGTLSLSLEEFCAKHNEQYKKLIRNMLTNYDGVDKNRFRKSFYTGLMFRPDNSPIKHFDDQFRYIR